MQRQSLGDVDRPGGGHGAEEVAGVYGVDLHVLKPLFQGLDLAISVVRDQAVILSVDPAVEVSLSLRVADQIKCCHSAIPQIS